MNRRQFLEASAGVAGAAWLGWRAADAQSPWYRRAYLWGQTNITEKDPEQYDIEFWRGQWRRTLVQAVIINAGGIVAYYPSRFPLHHRAQFLDGRDLFGELTKAAHADGLFVMARMDSNRAAEDFYQAHPDWFARDTDGKPYRAADKYIACINSPYYDEYLPDVLREIAERSKPDGFTDNSWAGMGRENICFCTYCERRFRERSGKSLPRRADWDDAGYRQWVLWNYARRIEIWDLNNQTTRAAGGADCIWSGMNSGSVTAQARSFRDLREICRRADIVMLDHQRRDDDTGFQQNGDTGKRVHGLLGWDKLAPESMAMYESGPGYYRVASKPAAEARMWMIAGIAGGIQPWWHYVGARQEDRRMFATPVPVTEWWKANEEYLVNRTPLATVGLAWSQRSTDFYGRDAAESRVDLPYTGFMHALVRARIPYLPVHVDDIGTEPGLRLLILPNVGALSDAQVERIRAFVRDGGSLVATGDTSLYDEWGDPRSDFALADLFSCHRPAPAPKLAAGRGAPRPSEHTYLRLSASDRRDSILRGFEDTDLIAYGGTLQPLNLEPGAAVPLTFVPPFPTYPPETAWMRQPATDIPGLVLSTHAASRVAYLPADIDRRYALEHLPDHAALLGNVIRWALGERTPILVDGPGLVDCHLYEQPGRTILHLVNLTSEATWRAPLDELITVGPFAVQLRVRTGVPPRTARLLVSGATPRVTSQNGYAAIRIDTIRDHEVVVWR